MEYLPSKQFVTKVLIIFLGIGGWFWFYGDKNVQKSIAKTEEKSAVMESNGSLIYVRPKTENISFDAIPQWKDIKNEQKTVDTGSEITPATNSGNINTQTNTQKPVEQTRIAPRYTKENLLLSSDESKTTLEQYGKNLATALKPYSSDKLPNEVEALINWIDTGSKDEMDKILLMKEIHTSVFANLLKVKVPQSTKKIHLNLVNDVKNMADLAEKMIQTADDPTSALIIPQQYKTKIVNLAESLVEIDNYFKNKNINFSEENKIHLFLSDIN